MSLVINPPKALPLQMGWLDTVRLLSIVTQAGKVYLADLIPNEPIFLLHQQVGNYSSSATSVVGCRPVAGTSDYEPDGGENWHYFGAQLNSNVENRYYTCQSMIFVPSRATMTLEFDTAAPPSASRRILIFQ